MTGLSELLLAAAYYKWAFYGDLAVNVVCWLGVLTLLVLGKKYLNKETAFCSAPAHQNIFRL